MGRTSCSKCGSDSQMRSNGLCRLCDNKRVREITRAKRATPEGRAEYNTYMREYKRRKKSLN